MENKPANMVMLEDLEPYIYDTIGGENVGINAPDEHDSILGYATTREEAREVLKEWFEERGYIVCKQEELNKIENALTQGKKGAGG